MYVDQSYSLLINLSWNFIDYFQNVRKLSQMLCFLEILFRKFLLTKSKVSLNTNIFKE